ncbi:hypothetical protein [Virgibacillus sp. YIM 98842]|uniref:hypothetical protein n=1 Tax=Virgibacillus sp. YIM 98842 TaxID=2663533 RepID=UPI0013D8E9C9|nr:hypothetical protein [Virgibacillus sp. YIM 98842]
MNKYVKNMAISGIVVIFLFLAGPAFSIPFGIAHGFILMTGVYAIYLNYRELALKHGLRM